jgi:hypothetical protein
MPLPDGPKSPTSCVRRSNLRFHPGFDIDHRFPKGFMDHPLDRPVAAELTFAQIIHVQALFKFQRETR